MSPYRILLFVAILCLYAGSVSGSVQYKPCGTPKDHFKIHSLTLQPNPCPRDSNLTLNIAGTTDEVITFGTATLEVFFGEFKVITVTHDLCTNYFPFSCPIPRGNVNFHKSLWISRSWPPGYYVGTLKLTDQNWETVTCVKFEFRICGPRDCPGVREGSDAEDVLATIEQDISSFLASSQ